MLPLLTLEARGGEASPFLVLTNDGGGDGLCATINVGEKGKIRRLAQVTTEHSLGYIYSMFTFILGMVPEEHESKVMGMAPYCSEGKMLEIAEKFRKLIDFNLSDGGITWARSKVCHRLNTAISTLGILLKECGLTGFVEVYRCSLKKRC